MSKAPDISGADTVVAWFGYWPTFHDAEVLSIAMNRSGESHVAIHAFEKTPEMDANGYYVLTKHCIVTFHLEGFPLDEQGICNTRVEFFNYQNVLSSAGVNKIANGYELVLKGIFGVDGSIMCEGMRVTLEPGKPSPSAGQSLYRGPTPA